MLQLLIAVLLSTPPAHVEPCAGERDAMFRRASELSDARDKLRAAFMANAALVDTFGVEREFVDAYGAFRLSVFTYKTCTAKAPARE
jgi:hypothetical protein